MDSLELVCKRWRSIFLRTADSRFGISSFSGVGWAFVFDERGSSKFGLKNCNRIFHPDGTVFADSGSAPKYKQISMSKWEQKRNRMKFSLHNGYCNYNCWFTNSKLVGVGKNDRETWAFTATKLTPVRIENIVIWTEPPKVPTS